MVSSSGVCINLNLNLSIFKYLSWDAKHIKLPTEGVDNFVYKFVDKRGGASIYVV
jgi:hypothetical protein